MYSNATVQKAAKLIPNISSKILPTTKPLEIVTPVYSKSIVKETAEQLEQHEKSKEKLVLVPSRRHAIGWKEISQADYNH